MAVMEVDDGDGTEWREMDGRGLGWTGLDWIGLGGCELTEGGDRTRCGYDDCRYVVGGRGCGSGKVQAMQRRYSTVLCSAAHTR